MSDSFNVGALTSHPSGGFQNFELTGSSRSAVSFGGTVVSNTESDSVIFRAFPKGPPQMQLPFNPARLSASPQTLQLAGLWPKESTLQLLLQAIIEIAASKNLGAVLTAPSAVALAGSTLRMVEFLLPDFKSGKLKLLDWTELPVSLGMKEAHSSAVQQFAESGWNDPASLPRSILNEWWKLAKRRWPPLVEALTDTEAERFACGVVCKRWIEILLDGMDAVARAIGSPLLSLRMFKSITVIGRQNSDNFEFALHSSVVSMCKVLGTDFTPNIHTTYLFGGVQSCGSSRTLVSSHPQEVFIYFDEAAIAEDNATARILDGDSWYHQPRLVQLIAHQFINGTRQSHFSDTLLAKLKLQPTQLQGLLPLTLLIQEHQQYTLLLKKLHLTATDAHARDWNLSLDFDGGRGQLIDAQWITSPLARVVIQSTGKPCADGPKMKHSELPKGSPWSEFQIHLSLKQQQVLDQLKLASELNTSQWIEATEPDETTQHLAAKPVPLAPPFSQFENDVKSVLPRKQLQIPSCFRSVQRAFAIASSNGDQLDFSTHYSQDTMIEWRAHVFEKIAFQALPLLDYGRWGMQRFANMHPKAARRNFQSCIINAAMQANGIPMLPTVLVNLIVDYHHVDALPYITNEEQEALVRESSSTSKSAFCETCFPRGPIGSP